MDIDGMYDALGVDTDNLGCVMLDIELTGLQYTPAMLAFEDMGFLPYEHHVTLLYGLLKPAIESMVKEKYPMVYTAWVESRR